jgi:cytochrome b subunit of formate dehydrogenase
MARIAAWLRTRRNVLRIGRWCGWAALGLIALSLVSGYGISSFRTVESLTLGLMGKAGSLRLHHYTAIPVALFTLLHVGIGFWGRRSAMQRVEWGEHDSVASPTEGDD